MSAQAVRATQRQPGVSSQPPPQTRSRTPPQTRGRSPTRRGLLRDKSLERALFGDDQYDKQVDDTAELIRQQNEEYERIAEQERKQNIHALSKSIVESVTQPHYIGQLTESQPAAAASSSGHKPSSQPAASASPKDHTPIDNHITISHWRQQPKEYLQSQLLLRIPDHPSGIKNLNKTELLDKIKKLINF